MTLPLAPMRRHLTAVLETTGEGLERAIGAGLARKWYRAQMAGGVSPAIADELAVKVCRLHPSAIWGDAWWSE